MVVRGTIVMSATTVGQGIGDSSLAKFTVIVCKTSPSVFKDIRIGSREETYGESSDLE